jgi:lipoyl(octanoyl) transferase
MRWAWLGRVAYADAWRMQEDIRAGILAGRDEAALLLLEHDPVVTLGRSTRPEHLPVPIEEIRRRGIDVVETSRGGSVTFHGPGQLVGYPVTPLVRGVREHVRALGEAIAAVLDRRGVPARYRGETPGVWVDELKIASIGIHVRRGVAIHGFALNVDVDLAAFQLIVPCGLQVRMTSIAQWTSLPVRVSDVLGDVVRALGDQLGVELCETPASAPCAAGSC